MLKRRINELVISLPEAANIYPVPQSEAAHSNLFIHRRAHALLDPSFAWHYANAFAGLGLPLPSTVTEPAIRRAHEFLLNGTLDDDLIEALTIREPNWKMKRAFVEALLLLRKLRLDEVAAYAGISVFAVELYERLFWNVRDRLNDHMFINGLVYPETRHVEYSADYWKNTDPSVLMLRAAFHQDLDTVLKIYGVRTERDDSATEPTVNSLRSRILAEADHIVRAGGVNQAGLPVLELGRKLLIAAERENGDKRGATIDEIGLSALSVGIDYSILETVRQLTDNSVYDRRVEKQSADMLLKSIEMPAMKN